MEGENLFFIKAFFQTVILAGVKVFQKSNIFYWISRPIFPSQVYYYCYCGLAFILVSHTSIIYFKPTTPTYNVVSLCFQIEVRSEAGTKGERRELFQVCTG